MDADEAEAVAGLGGDIEEGVGGSRDFARTGDRERATRLACDCSEVGVAQLEYDRAGPEAVLIETPGDAPASAQPAEPAQIVLGFSVP